MKQHLGRIWRSLKIKRKIKLFTDVVFFVILLSIVLAFWVIKSSLLDFSVILQNNSMASDFLQCMENETDLFETYIRTGEEDSYRNLKQAMEATGSVVSQLPFEFEKIGEKRYARTWSVLNMYQIYSEKRDHVLDTGGKTPDYISELYEVYDIQDYLQSYAKQLMRDTLEDGVSVYADKVRIIIIVPALIIFFELLFFFCIRKVSELMNGSIVEPVVELAEASRKISENDFFIKDIEVQSEDELGELVQVFNKMKYATGEYIKALEEKRKALDLYHAEEMEKLEIASRLDAMELDLLKSQINPHFLFNTLNVIGGMANLEGAQTTEKMIQALSSLFRYNLKTPEEKVSLTRELKVISDYMFLQKMRFGDRIEYQIDCQTDAELVMIPTFTFQPLVENAIIHGLVPKEEGGHIFIRIRERNAMIRMTIADDGLGIDKETLCSLKRQMQEEESGRTSIGLFNIYKRVHSMYDNGRMHICSKVGVGTIISIMIPDERGNRFEG
ncbi:MAG: histidine kinase [Lachnospiraceae bacterium]|nr:histidine kinase [Lachnospiraceae bacterium]